MKAIVLIGLFILGVVGTVTFGSCAFLSFIFYLVIDRAFDYWTLWSTIGAGVVMLGTFFIMMVIDEKETKEWHRRHRELLHQFQQDE